MRIEEWITAFAGYVRRAPHHVRRDLGATGRVPNHEPLQVAEHGRAAGLVQPPPRPLRQFVEPVFLAPDLQAPGLLRGRRRVAQLRERNPQLGGPAERVDGGRNFPDRIPGRIAAAAEAVGVLLDARGIDLEEQASDVIVIGVEDHFEIIGVHVGVAPHEASPDPARAGVVVHPRADVDRRVVVREPHLGALGGGVAGVGLGLAQAGRHRGRAPHVLVELAVEMDRLAELDRPDLRRGVGMDVLGY